MHYMCVEGVRRSHGQAESSSSRQKLCFLFEEIIQDIVEEVAALSSECQAVFTQI